MTDIKATIAGVDWQQVTANLHEKGYALVPKNLFNSDCKNLISDYDIAALYRKTIVMERYRFGAGEYKYFNYPLPALIQSAREEVYARLAPVANKWERYTLGIIFHDSLT